MMNFDFLDRGSIFCADELNMAGSTCMALVRRNVLKVVGQKPVNVTLPDGRVIIRKANIYKKIV